jgi:glycosyltransferase involved in cell wall biosynthesis
MRGGTGISVCLVNRDSVLTLKDCLESVQSIADELVVVDTGSSDRSPELAKLYGARVIHSRWHDDFSAARNVYLREARCPWILSLDSDEVLSAVNKTDLQPLLMRFPRMAFQLNIRGYFQLREFAGTIGPDDVDEEALPGIGVTLTRAVRLFPNLPGLRYCYPIHESLLPSLHHRNVRVKFLDIPIHHFGLLEGRRALMSRLPAYKTMGIKKIERFPDFYLGYFELGKLLLLEEKPAEAVKLFATCIRLHPNFVQGHYQFCLSLFKLERWEECGSHVERALMRFPGCLNLIYLRGLLESRKGRCRPALECFVTVLRQKPFHYPAYFHLAKIYVNMGNYKKAEKISLEALERFPCREEFYLLLARIAELKGNGSRARAVLREGLSILPRAAELRAYLDVLQASLKRMVIDEPKRV